MPERLNSNPEASKSAAELEKSSAERERALERIREAAETAKERERESDHEQEARHEALEQAAEKEQAAEMSTEVEKPQQITKDDRDASYKQTMHKMQQQLPPASRAFSKVIHNPAIEKTSEVVGNTIARPNLIIAGALGAIISVIVYFIAKRYGYILSGSETIILFIAGWLIGAIIEYARVGFLNKKD